MSRITHGERGKECIASNPVFHSIRASRSGGVSRSWISAVAVEATLA